MNERKIGICELLSRIGEDNITCVTVTPKGETDNQAHILLRMDRTRVDAALKEAMSAEPVKRIRITNLLPLTMENQYIVTFDPSIPKESITLEALNQPEPIKTADAGELMAAARKTLERLHAFYGTKYTRLNFPELQGIVNAAQLKNGSG